MFRTSGFGRRPCNRQRRRRRRGLTDFDECMSYYWRIINYNPHTGAVDEDDDDDDDDVSEQAEPVTLKVQSVDPDIRNNAVSHHTNEFDITDASVYDDRELLVVRRGQLFNMTINFNRAYNTKEDELRLVFAFGKCPRISKGTQVELYLSDEDIPNEWGAFKKSNEGNSLSIAIMTPPTLPVGKWSLKIDVVKKKNKKANVYRYDHSDPIYILFNPWCKDDQVYMEQEKYLEEYVLNETGELYRGSYRRISACPWNFGQFTGDVLDCVMYLLDKKSELPDHVRGDPVKVARKISSLVNGCDNEGVIEGNWSGTYTGGTSPLDWTGSVDILDKYFKTKQPVKFGQCWVFSALTTTVCRALGIPVRSLTNFSSAHDTDESTTIDSHFGVDGDEIEYLNDDSVWNFHVWNDVWMARPDLPDGYGGWQAIDATPQETSGGQYCMGPMSLKAIRNGDVNLPHDGRFAFAEVNADRVYWTQNDDGKMIISRVVKNSVGKYISTKQPFGKGPWSYRNMFCPYREDITAQYKFPEGSIEERAAVRRANQHSTNKEVYESKIKDVTFDLISDEETFIGKAIKLCLKMKNTTDSQRTVTGTIKLSTVYYTGVINKEVLKHTIEGGEVLKAKEEKCINLEIPFEDYQDNLVDDCHFKIACKCTVAETGQIFTDIDDLRLRKPHLDMKAPDKCCTGKQLETEVAFENPLPVTLTQCELRVEGPGLQKTKIIKLQNVNAKQTFTRKIDMIPVKPGQKEIIVSFSSKQLAAINASLPVDISKQD